MHRGSCGNRGSTGLGFGRRCTPVGGLSRDRRRRWRRLQPSALWLFVLILCTASPGRAQAAGDLLVLPQRLELEGRLRSAELTLVNRGREAATYRLSLVEMRMTEEGRLQRVEEDEAPWSAQRMLRFSPRRVHIEPGGLQTVRVLVRKPAQLAAGEYRSHLLMRAMPRSAAPSAVADPAAENESIAVDKTMAVAGERGIAIRLDPVFGVAVPIIVRHGNPQAEVSLQGLTVRDSEEGPRLHLRLQRSGDRSVYGDLVVSWSDDGATQHLLGELRGVAVYAPNRERPVEIPIDSLAELASGPSSARLEVRYLNRSSAPGSVHAQAELGLAIP